MQCLLLKVYIEKAKFQPEKKYKQKELKAAKHLQYLPKNAKSLTHTQKLSKMHGWGRTFIGIAFKVFCLSFFYRGPDVSWFMVKAPPLI